MKTVGTTDSRHFFFNERTARTMVILSALYGAGLIVLLFLGIFRPIVTMCFLLAVAIWPTSYCLWVILLGRRYPILTLSEGLIEWRESSSRKRSSIPTAEIVEAEKVTTHVLVLKTTSKGSVRIPLTGLSVADRQEIKEFMASQYGA